MTESQNFGIRDLILNWMKRNDPALNLNLKIIKSFKFQNYKFSRHRCDKKPSALILKKNSNIINKISLDQYKIEANK